MGCKGLSLTGVVSAMLFFSVVIPSTSYAQNDPKLIQALRQSTHDAQSNTTDLDQLVWLSDMSANLVRRLPNPFYRIRLLETIHREASLVGLDPQLVLAVIDIESNFNRYAQSHVGAQGLMQVMPFWKKVHGSVDDDLFNPQVNIRYGCKILRHYMDKYDNPVDSLAAYNGSLGKKKYPNKVYARLNRQWTFEKDAYSNNDQSKLALRN